MRSILDRAGAWWWFHETVGGFVLLGVVAAVFAAFLLMFSIGRAPTMKTTGVVTGFWGEETDFRLRSGVLARLGDGRIVRIIRPIGGDCRVGDTVELWDQPTLLGHRVSPRTQTCRRT